MRRKILICAALVLMMCAGCGGEKVAGSPDKAILAYVETVMTGEADLEAAGFGSDYAQSIRLGAVNSFIDKFNEIVPLSDDVRQKLTNIYFDKLKGAIKFEAKLKIDGDTPVVELITTPIDYAGTAKAAVGDDDDDLMALLGMVGQLKADGASDDQLKTNSDVQKLAVTAFTKFIANISFREEKTFEVPCSKITDPDGLTHWAPADAHLLIDFLTGQD